MKNEQRWPASVCNTAQHKINRDLHEQSLGMIKERTRTEIRGEKKLESSARAGKYHAWPEMTSLSSGSWVG